MSSEVGDPEARRGEAQMGNPTRGSADVKSILGYPNSVYSVYSVYSVTPTRLPGNTFTIGGEKYTRLPPDEYSYYRTEELPQWEVLT